MIIPRDRMRAVQLSILLLATLVGLTLRVQAVPAQFEPDRCQQADVYRYYVSTAESFLQGQGWVTDYAWNFIPPPLQAGFVVAARTLLPGADFRVMRYIQAALSTCTILLAAWIGFQLGGRWAAVAAAVLLALDLNIVHFVGILLAENNYFFLLFAFIGVLLVALKRESLWLTAAAGGLLALTSLMKPFPMFLALLVPLWMVLRRWERPTVLRAAAFLAAFCLLVSPWLVRNHQRYGQIYLISTNSGTLLAQSNFDRLDPSSPEMIFWESIYRTDIWKSPEIEARFDGEVDRYGQLEWNRKDRAYFRHTLAYVLAHPFHFARNHLIKTYNVFRYPSPRYPSDFYRLVLMLLGLAGLIWFARREWRSERAVLLLIFGYYAFFTALMHIVESGRMNLPLKLLLTPFAAYLLSRLAAEFGLFQHLEHPGEVPTQRRPGHAGDRD